MDLVIEILIRHLTTHEFQVSCCHPSENPKCENDSLCEMNLLLSIATTLEKCIWYGRHSLNNLSEIMIHKFWMMCTDFRMKQNISKFDLSFPSPHHSMLGYFGKLLKALAYIQHWNGGEWMAFYCCWPSTVPRVFVRLADEYF